MEDKITIVQSFYVYEIVENVGMGNSRNTRVLKHASTSPSSEVAIEWIRKYAERKRDYSILL
jgi:hypothetical protein